MLLKISVLELAKCFLFCGIVLTTESFWWVNGLFEDKFYNQITNGMLTSKNVFLLKLC